MTIKLSNVIKTWRVPGQPDRTVLNLPTFVAEEGDRICLVGYSGSGKTTLLNIIAGIVMPTEGQVSIGGQEITTMAEPKRDLFRAQNIGYVFQTFNLLQSLSAVENVQLAATFSGMPKNEATNRALELLRRVGLEHRLDAKPSRMSVGEQQRVAIARALVNRPQIVLADEPTANLDQDNGDEVIELLKETTVEEKSILLLVTHDQQVHGHFEDVRQLKELLK